jgi:hypothetical protein
MLNVVRPAPLPRFWWLFPWALVIEQRRNIQYLETILSLDDRIIRRQDRDIKELNAGIERLADIVNRRPLY